MSMFSSTRQNCQADRDFIGAFEKGLAVIDAFNASEVALTAAVVAEKTGLTRAGARRYLLTLTKLDTRSSMANFSPDAAYPEARLCLLVGRVADKTRTADPRGDRRTHE